MSQLGHFSNHVSVSFYSSNSTPYRFSIQMSEISHLNGSPEDPQPGKGGKKRKRKIKKCEEDGCTKGALAGSNRCFKHGGGKKCSEEDCNKSVQGGTDKCIGHGGGNRCADPVCNNSAVGGTKWCVGHGGGKRCADPVCNNGARGGFDFCIGHGGGKRCADPVCNNSAVGGTDYCIGHDGGKRCAQPGGCNKSAQGGSNKCVEHGGGIRCPNCVEWIDSRCGQSKYDGYCATCFKHESTEKSFGKLIIDQVGFEPNSKDKTIASGSECKGLDKRRPDLLWVVEGTVAVVVEIDEHSHSGYEPSCEARKISEQTLAIQKLDGCQNVPVFTIRVNPDSYDVKIVQKETRADMVANKVKELLKGEYERNGYAKLFFCCYHTRSKHLIEEQRKHWECEILY